MWTLECDGDSLAHKRVWLRPGKTYLFGRTKVASDHETGFRIDHKSVSRQHLTLTVSSVKQGTGSSLNVRSKITLKDEDTKYKTELDGERIKKESRMLKKDEHVFRLGNSEQVFRLKWKPVVFTFSFSSKDMRPGKDPLAPFRIRLEELDIKVIVPYIIRSTTHVIAGKRNTAKGLQALINGRYVVSESFIDALIYSATPSNLDEAESLSPLEEDFDAHWPNALKHLPVRSKEPSDRPVEDYAPNPERLGVFEGYTFIFCDKAQFETLQDPINNGGGKALEFELDQGKTTAEEIVRFVKNAAGEKGLGELEDGSEGRGVVVIKFRGDKNHEEWAANLDLQVAQMLDLRLVEQSEFLDAILLVNAGVLRRPLQPSNSDSVSTYENAGHVRQPEASTTQASRPRTRTKVVSRFKGYDDDDDDEPMNIQSSHKASTSRMNETSQEEDASEQLNDRKRPLPSPEHEDDEALVDKLLPAATALKRRKIADEANGIHRDTPDLDRPSLAPAAEIKPKKEINIKEVVRERRKAEDEAARLDEETFKESIEGMTVEEMKRLAVVEEMHVPARRTSATKANGGVNGRWDESWNGRKNFKKFRRKGDESHTVRRGPSVMVPLEEAKTKNFGIGDAFWPDNSERARNRTQRAEASQSQSQRTQPNSMPSQPRTVEKPAELLVGDEGDTPEVVDLEAPRTTRNQDRSQRTQTQQSSGFTPTADTVTGKRPASGPSGMPVVKRRKKFAAAKNSDSED